VARISQLEELRVQVDEFYAEVVRLRARRYIDIVYVVMSVKALENELEQRTETRLPAWSSRKSSCWNHRVLAPGPAWPVFVHDDRWYAGIRPLGTVFCDMPQPPCSLSFQIVNRHSVPNCLFLLLQ
jgi:hypothetical protein